MDRWKRKIARRFYSFLKPAQFSGAYSSFADVPDVGAGYDGQGLTDAYIENYLTRPEQCLNNPHSPGLHALVKLANSLPGDVEILDFGGGYGTVRAALDAIYPLERSRFKVTLCETKAMIASLRRVTAKMNGELGMTMAETIDPQAKFHIVYSGSSLQYLEFYSNILTIFSEIGENIIIDDLPTCNVGSFVARQINYDPGFPAWVFNQDEISQFFKNRGFHLNCLRENERMFSHENAPKYMLRESSSFFFSLAPNLDAKFQLQKVTIR